MMALIEHYSNAWHMLIKHYLVNKVVYRWKKIIIICLKVMAKSIIKKRPKGCFKMI